MITLELMSLLVGVSGIEMRLCFSHCDPILDGGNFVDLRFHCMAPHVYVLSFLVKIQLSERDFAADQSMKAWPLRHYPEH
jgi:hypothetical protein